MTQPVSDRRRVVNDVVEESAHAIGQLVDLLEALPGNLYSALLAATASPGVLLDYENRNRDLLLETDRQTAGNRLSDILETLRNRFGTKYAAELAMLHNSDGQRQVVTTSVDRELVFLASHTIHHMAIIGMLAEQAGVDVGGDFGVHPSTLRYLQRQTSDMARSA